MRYLFGGPCRDCTLGDNDVDPAPDQLSRIFPEPINVARAPPVLQEDMLALDIPQLAETLGASLTAVGQRGRRKAEIRDPGDRP
jgi:hypothetical protein